MCDQSLGSSFAVRSNSRDREDEAVVSRGRAADGPFLEVRRSRYDASPGLRSWRHSVLIGVGDEARAFELRENRAPAPTLLALVVATRAAAVAVEAEPHRRSRATSSRWYAASCLRCWDCISGRCGELNPGGSCQPTASGAFPGALPQAPHLAALDLGTAGESISGRRGVLPRVGGRAV